MQMQDIQETVKVTLSLISESKRQTTTTNSNIDHCERERDKQGSWRIPAELLWS